MIKMLKGHKKHIDKQQGKTKHEAPRSVNKNATQNKNNMGQIQYPTLNTHSTKQERNINTQWNKIPNNMLGHLS